MPEEKKSRKRMIVEEVSEPSGQESKKAEILESGISDTSPVEEIKENVEKLETLTEGISESAEKSSEVQKEIAEAAEKVEEPMAEHFEPAGPQKSSSSVWWIIIPGIFLLGALLGGIYFYQKGVKLSVVTPTPTEMPSAESTPTSSPSAQIDLAKFPINVENGSGIAGTAAAAKDLLTAAGFTVSGTGNAATYDYKNTVIQAKSDVPEAFLTKLSETLTKSYVLDKNQSLPDTSTDEVVVIVGSAKSQ